MRITPGLPPPVTVAENDLGVDALTRVKPAKPVQERTLPPLIVQRHARHEAAPEIAGREEKRRDTHVHGERRTFCRRIEHLPLIVELRSKIERRHSQQRKGDAAEHVDEEV